MNLKRICTTLLLTIMLSVAAFATATTQEYYQNQAAMEAMEAFVDEVYGEGFFQNHLRAEEQINAIYDDFTGSHGRVVYPDFFGGLFINDYGRLVVYIVEGLVDSAMEHDIIGVLIADGDYKLTQISQTQLAAVRARVDTAISNAWRDGCVYASNVSMWGSGANQISVRLAVYSDEMIDGFRRYVYDSPLIEFSQADFLIIGGAPQYFWERIPSWLLSVLVLGGVAVGFVASVVAVVVVVRRLVRRRRNHVSAMR